jgi:hypothetical protein
VTLKALLEAQPRTDKDGKTQLVAGAALDDMMHGLQEALAAHPLQSMVHVLAFFEAVGLIKALFDDAEDGGGAPRITNFIYPPEVADAIEVLRQAKSAPGPPQLVEGDKTFEEVQEEEP